MSTSRFTCHEMVVKYVNPSPRPSGAGDAAGWLDAWMPVNGTPATAMSLESARGLYRPRRDGPPVKCGGIMTGLGVAGMYYGAWANKKGALSGVPLAPGFRCRGPGAAFDAAGGYRAMA